jgi:hypothetical protein
MSLKGDVIAVTIGAAVLLAAAWYAKKKLSDAGAAVADMAGQAWDAAKEVTVQTAQVVDKTVSWPVLTAGDALGVPRTNMTECEKAKAEGRTWDASFACPAGDFLGYVFQ